MIVESWIRFWSEQLCPATDMEGMSAVNTETMTTTTEDKDPAVGDERDC